MSLAFTVCGPYVRVLLNTLACVSRIGDVVFVEGVEDGIEVSAVSPTGNSHIAVRVHRHCFARLNVSHAPQHGGADAAALHGASADVHEPPVASPPVHLCVLTKTLAATVLRQHNSSNVQTLELRYRTESCAAAEAEDGDDADGAGDGDRELWQGREEADLVRLHCTYARGVTKTFLLRLTDGEPRSVAVDASLYHFEVCGAARTYGQLLGSLPTSANRCSLTLLESGGLELRSAQQPSYPGMDSAARSGGGRGGNHSAAASGGAGAGGLTGRGGVADSSSETKVTAFPKTFSLFRYFEADTAGEPTEAESGPSEVPPTPSPTPHASPPTGPQHSGGNFTAPTVTTGFIALPQKSFDVKPVKNAAWLAEQLGTQLHVLLGAEGVPLRLGSITEEELEHRRGAAAALSDANQRTTGSTLRQGSLLAGGAGRRPGYTSGGRVSEPSSASFTVYVAAEDKVVDAARGGAGGVGRGSAGGAADTSLATAISSAATSPRHSTHARASRGVGGGVAGGVGGAGGGIAGVTAAAGAAAAPPSATSVLVGATHSSMNASLSTAEGEHGRVGVTPDETGAWQEDYPDLQWRRDRTGQALDPHSPSPSHVADSFTSQQGSSSHNSNGAEEGTGAGPGRGHPRQPRESASTVDSAYATPRPSASPLGSTLVVMTGNETPAMPPMPGARADGAEYMVGALHSVAATPPVLVSPSAGSRVSMTGATQEASAATALNSMYPLDFEAFVRTYTSAQEEGGGEGEDGAEDPQDAELREFLASCVASLSREPTQS